MIKAEKTKDRKEGNDEDRTTETKKEEEQKEKEKRNKLDKPNNSEGCKN